MRYRSRSRPWPWVTMLLALAACSSGDPLDPGGAQGIDGLVLLGPQCPVQSLEDPCPDLPYEASIAVRTAGGEFVTRIRSGEDGRFRVGLIPGRYVLDPEEGDPFPIASEQEVAVGDGAYTEVIVNFDTGIR
ncbi:MAG: carboxypeptidase regulatory-like domain-containing protein [Gemmatimonadetes bacterium]|nr:carboxypeptidase regulatory-like domain-containing protein [Gemmatimonadota bacterium]